MYFNCKICGLPIYPNGYVGDIVGPTCGGHSNTSCFGKEDKPNCEHCFCKEVIVDGREHLQCCNCFTKKLKF